MLGGVHVLPIQDNSVYMSGMSHPAVSPEPKLCGCEAPGEYDTLPILNPAYRVSCSAQRFYCEDCEANLCEDCGRSCSGYAGWLNTTLVPVCWDLAKAGNVVCVLFREQV